MHPLTVSPNNCTEQSLPTRLKVQTYQDPDHFSEAKSSYPPVTGCEKQLFKPLLYARPTSSETDSPSGLDIVLKDTQFLGYAVSPAEIRDATVVLPPGLTINPDAADGQSACTDAQANFGSEAPAACPDSAKIGTTALHTPALSGPLPGSLYIGEPKPGNQYRLFLVVDGFGIHAKLVGSVLPNPQTGQVAVHFEELPQVPFDEFDVHLFSSDRGLMATPTNCTTYVTEAQFVPWNPLLPVASSNQAFSLTAGPNGSPCPGQVRPFKPTLSAGTSNSQAGGFSSFSLKLNREDGDQYLGKLNFEMPPGLTADLRGVAYCPEAGILAAANMSGRSRAGGSQLPGELADRHLERRRRSGEPSLPCDRQGLPRRALQRRPALPRGDHARAGRALRLRHRRRPRRDQHRPARRPRRRRLRNGAGHHRRSPHPDAGNPGRYRPRKVHDQPDELQPEVRRHRRGSATREPSPTSPPTSTPTTARRFPSSRR